MRIAVALSSLVAACSPSTPSVAVPRCPPAVSLPLRDPAAPGVTANFDGYTEGVVFGADDTAYVSALHRETVYRVPKNDAPAVWFRVKEPNGHKILADGSHLIAARGGIYHVGADAHLLDVLATTIATPNDLALDGDGGFYISAPAEREEDQQRKRSGVYYVDAKGTVHPVAEGLCYPNGLVVRPDGRALLLNDTCTRMIYEFGIVAPGTLVSKRTFAEVSDTDALLDGMTFDQDGQLYVADYGTGAVVVFDSGGRLLRRHATGLRHSSNVAFGGPDLRDLYVSGSPGAQEGVGQLVVLSLGVRGRSSRAMPVSIIKQ